MQDHDPLVEQEQNAKTVEEVVKPLFLCFCAFSTHIDTRKFLRPSAKAFCDLRPQKCVVVYGHSDTVKGGYRGELLRAIMDLSNLNLDSRFGTFSSRPLRFIIIEYGV